MSGRAVLPVVCAALGGACAALLFAPPTFGAPRSGPTPAPIAPAEHTSDAELAGVQDALARLEARVAELAGAVARAAAVRVERGDHSERTDVAPSRDAELAELRSLIEEVREILRTGASGGDALMADVAKAALRHPDQNLPALIDLSAALGGEEEKATARRWLLRPAADVIATFGRPTDCQAGRWCYTFVVGPDIQGWVDFRLDRGLVIGCSGSQR